MLGELTRKNQTHGRLNLARRDCGSLVVGGELGRFTGDTFEDVVHERVHDRHGLVGDTSVWMNLYGRQASIISQCAWCSRHELRTTNLLENLVDVGCVGLATDGPLLGLFFFLAS